ncbi:MAG: DUF3568 family protein [Deltaproteobacteria bacterium]|nr:DUF3568 family protein [Deltaproteobacteria bacterium]
MVTTKKCLLLLVMGVFLLSGCPAAIVGGAAAGAGSGTYLYVNGELKADYNSPLEKVWAACEKTVADMRGLDVEPIKEIARGTINAVIDDEKVKITVEYKARNVTTVAIRVGMLGSKLSSQLLHDKVADNLVKK